MSKKTWSELVQNQMNVGSPPTTTISTNDESNQNTAEENIQTRECISFNDIMSEQLALDLSVKQPLNEDSLNELSDPELPSGSGIQSSQALQQQNFGNESSLDCSNDEMLAKLLQHELDLEHDRWLRREEKKYNANSKVTLSFEKQRRIKNEDLNDSDLEDDDVYHEYGEESKHWDFFEQKEKQAPKIGKQGYVITKNGDVKTKHDIELNQCRNACKVMEFESDIRTGDGGSFPMKLNNQVYNALKVHSINEGKRMARLHEKKEKSSAEKAVDANSRILLFKLINRGILETMNGIIATGKESVVIHGIGQNPEREIPVGEVAVKVFKTTITEFQNRIQYVVGDPILEQTGKLSKQNPKLTIPFWAEKEMHNLNRMKKCGIKCPEVVFWKKHILIMTFIGKDGRPAPTLKNLIFSEDLFKIIWDQTVKLMVKLYKECDMVHADLSEYNLLWHENKLWCIDVSQAVRTTHLMAYRFLWRDCVNICKFFSKKLCDFKSPSQLFEIITGKTINDINKDDAELFDKMENYERNRGRLENRCDQDIFDELFEKALRSREAVKA